MARYIELDSTYRDRNQYPYPASFTVGLAQSGTKTVETAIDPIAYSSPILAWNSSFDSLKSANFIPLTNPPIILSSLNTLSSRTRFIIKAATTYSFRPEDDYYAGSVLRITGLSINNYRRIIGSSIIQSGLEGLLEITIESALNDGAYTGGSIYDPTNSTNTYENAQLFLPSSMDVDNFYHNYYVENISLGETKRISAYDGTTHMATLASSTTLNWGGNGNYDFVIRKEAPIHSGNIPVGDAINTLGGISSNLKVVQLNSTATSNHLAYRNSFLRLDHQGSPLTPNSALAGSTNAPYGEEIKIRQYITLSGTFVAHGGVGTATFTLSDGSTTNDYYVDCFITNSTTGETRAIATYNGTTKVGTVTQNWGAGTSGNVFFIRTAFLLTAFTTAPTTGNTLSAGFFSIESITRDNYVPLSYSGTMVSSQQEVCYDVELLNLVLPNTTLASGGGGRAIFYPYVYVKLDTITNSKGNNLIYSNNPHSTKILFRAVVDDTTLPVSAPFIKINSDGMVQTVKFKGNDGFVFSVLLPNGELFKTLEQEFVSPTVPNPMIQISASFSFKRHD